MVLIFYSGGMKTISGLKYFFLFIGSFYCYVKMLNLRLELTNKLIFVVSAVFIGIGATFIKEMPPLVIVYLIVCFLILCLKMFKHKFKIIITCTIISFGLSYCASIISSSVTSVLFVLFFRILEPTIISEMMFLLLNGIIQFFTIYFPFKLKRYRNGLNFLYKYANEDVAVYISFGILVYVLFTSSYQINSIFIIIPISCILLLGLFLIFWWRNRIKQEYITQIRLRELSELKEELLQSKSEIETLKEKNDNLSKIIHKDNKLIPALELSVRSFIQLGSQNIKDNDKALKLIEDLNNLSIDRKGILKSYEQNNIIAKETGFSGIDALIIYLKNKSLSEDINLSFSLECSIEEIVDIKISVRDFETVLADLLENAIIATKTCDTRQILLHWGLNTDNIFSLYVFDSADSFSPKVLENLGKKRFTTHKQDGGSGIGLFSLFDIAQKNKASIEINQNISSSIFKKKVGIVFDDMSKVRIS